MDLNLEKGTISLYGKNQKIDTLLTKLAGLSGDQVYGLFGHRGIMIPRRLNRMALISALNNRIKMLYSNQFSKEEFYHILKFKNFTVYQLVDLLDKIGTSDDFTIYRKNLFKLILLNNVALNLTDGELSYVKSLPTNKRKIGKVKEYLEYIFLCTLDQNGDFDGLDITLLRKNLLETASVEDVIALGKKYRIELENNELNAIVDELINKINTSEFDNSSITKLNSIDEAIPLEFSLDEEALSKKYARVIHYYNDELDEEKFNLMILKLKENNIEEEIKTINDEEEINNDNALKEDNQEIINEIDSNENANIFDKEKISEDNELVVEQSNDSKDDISSFDKVEISEENNELVKENSLTEKIDSKDDFLDYINNEESSLTNEVIEDKKDNELIVDDKKENKIAIFILILFMLMIIGVALYGVISIIK